MKKIALFSLFFVSGCIGLHDEPVYFKDNHQVYRATCNGSARDIGDCYALATKRCGGAFEVLDREDENIGSIKQEYKSTDYTRQSKQRTLDNDNIYDKVTDSVGHADTYGSGMKLKMINRTLLYYCK